MFTVESIEEIRKGEAIQQAAAAVNQALDGEYAAVALPEGMTIRDLENFLPQRRRARGTMKTTSVASFAHYVDEHELEGTSVFVTHNPMCATAVINLGTADKPGHADNLAEYRPQMTAAYAALLNVTKGQPLGQAQVAEFLEDWGMLIECEDENGVSLDLPKAIAAVRNITIDELRKVESTQEQLSASRSAFESVKATSKQPMPVRIRFSCSPYLEFSPRQFVMRLGIRTGDKPAITLRIVNAEQHDEEMAAELSERVKGAVGDSILVYAGDYTRKS